MYNKYDDFHVKIKEQIVIFTNIIIIVKIN